jgi:hypothetical protein
MITSFLKKIDRTGLLLERFSEWAEVASADVQKRIE